MQPAIQVEGLSKAYRLNLANGQGGMPDFRETIVNVLKTPLHRLRHGASHSLRTEEFWALDDVSFDVMPGEVLGIIGRNGAGKSTLLKILSRITEPTRGRAKIRGTVGSLLEVGTGFHPELSGRENVFLNAAILGMSRREVRGKFDEIVEFSGVEKFLDTPVKRYSSGMRVRLGFAVAAHLNPDILIVDEVLAVGDAEFQRKCLGKMREVANQQRTVIFVSHSMQAVSTLTTRCILLSSGSIESVGSPNEVIGEYLNAGGVADGPYRSDAHPSEPRVTRVEVITSEPGQVQTHGKPLEIELEIDTPCAVDKCSATLRIVDDYGRPVVYLWTFDSERPMCRRKGKYIARCRIPDLRLYLGRYSLTFHLSEGPGGKVFEGVERICPFEVVMHEIEHQFKWRAGQCVYIDKFNWDVQHVS